MASVLNFKWLSLEWTWYSGHRMVKKSQSIKWCKCGNLLSTFRPRGRVRWKPLGRYVGWFALGTRLKPCHGNEKKCIMLLQLPCCYNQITEILFCFSRQLFFSSWRVKWQTCDRRRHLKYQVVLGTTILFILEKAIINRLDVRLYIICHVHHAEHTVVK